MHMNSTVRTFLVCAIAFVVGRVLIFPGFIDPRIPSHDDLYRYYMIGQSAFLTNQWLSPRPVMIVFLKFLGGFLNDPGLFWLVLSCSSILFIAVFIDFLKTIKIGEIDCFSTFVYSVSIFSLPASYDIYQLDYGGMLSGIFCIASAHLYLKSPKELAFSGQLFFSLLLFWIALETKPTFPAVMLLLPAIDFFITRSRRSFLSFCGIAVISVLVVIKDKYFGSPFINLDGSGVYEVKIASWDNLVALFVYLKASAPIYLIPGLVMLYFPLRGKGRLNDFILFCPVLAIAAVMPMSLIPNRVLTLYSWYASVFLFLPCLFITSNYFSTGDKVLRIKAGVAIILLIVGGIIMSHKLFPSSAYIWKINQTNRNVIDSLLVIKKNYLDIATKKVLFSGLKGPFHAFRQSNFVRSQTNLNSYTLLLNNSESAWNSFSMNLGETVTLEIIDYNNFDLYYIFDTTGKIAYKLSKSELLAIPAWWRAAVVSCAASPDFKGLTRKDYEEALARLDYADESAAVIEMYEMSEIHNNIGATGYFHIASAYRKLKLFDKARSSILKALAFEDSLFFRQFLAAMETESGNANQ